MKKILAFLLVATMLVALFAMPSSAADSYVNATLTAEAIETAPNVTDGVVEYGEYGDYPALTYSENVEQFTHKDDHDDYNNWDFDFYITWDADNLYMAWVVKTEVHHPLTKATYDANGNITDTKWPEDGSMLGHMWWNSCIQFIITSGAPDASKSDYQTNYLEVGICELDDGSVGRTAWSYPIGVSADQISVNDWDASVKRDEEADTTTYEVAIPWAMSAISNPGDGAQFGLSFAVAAQESYYVTPGMLEWNDAILGTKDGDNAGIITLKGEDIGPISVPDILGPGPIPEEAEGAIQLPINFVNGSITAETTSLRLDKDTLINTNWAFAMLLDPVEGKENVYSLVATKQGDGSEVTFDDIYEDDMIILGVHSDGEANLVNKDNAVAIPLGSELTLFGVDVEEQELLYTNAMFYVSYLAEDNTSSEVSDDSSATSIEESSEVESTVESSEDASTESKEESKAPAASTSSEADDDDGSNAVLWIVIAVVAVAVIAVVVVVVLKKKKA